MVRKPFGIKWSHIPYVPEVVEGEAGTATSIKFIRSITAKGLSCLLIESLQAAQRFGVEQTDCRLVCGYFWTRLCWNYQWICLGSDHSRNGVKHELKNVVDFLQSEMSLYINGRSYWTKAWVAGRSSCEG